MATTPKLNGTLVKGLGVAAFALGVVVLVRRIGIAQPGEWTSLRGEKRLPSEDQAAGPAES